MVTQQRRDDTVYVMGRSDHESRRLELQDGLCNGWTRQLFARAGIGPGMKVLDVGSGTGAVARLAAEVVGERGSVTSVDVNPAILETARAKAAAAGLDNVSFLAGDIREMALPNDFDAVVGRYILMYLGNPAETLRVAASHVRPGGIVAFEERDWTLRQQAVPPSQHVDRARRAGMELARRAGMELAMGFKLRGAFLAAGLPEPRLHLDGLIGGGPDWEGYGYVAENMRSLLPMFVRFGVATEEEVGIDTFEQRFRDEVTAQDGVVMFSTDISAWTRTA
jgi:SAM-dependent methyltransferase